jgi:hypothetical protein
MKALSKNVFVNIEKSLPMNEIFNLFEKIIKEKVNVNMVKLMNVFENLLFFEFKVPVHSIVIYEYELRKQGEIKILDYKIIEGDNKRSQKYTSASAWKEDDTIYYT